LTSEWNLESIFRAESDRLVRTLTAAAGSRERAADAVQEAFVQAHLHWRRVQRYDDPVAWIRRVAVNRVLNKRRNGLRRDAALARLAPAPSFQQASTLPDPALAAALAALPLRQRTAVALRFLADLSVADVAVAMNISEGAVKSHVHRARQSLAAQLGDVRAD
jgi:RNA polymerase sigma-70 factor (ECF subfamily)